VTPDTVHGLEKPGGFLRQRRNRIAIWIAVAEGVLILFGVIPHLLVYVLAIVAVAFYALVARNYRSETAKQSAWIFGVSQLLSALVPLIWHATKLAAEVALVVIAVAGLIFLFTERERHES
jgi:predicted membrane channel-forming protein YqfA (hemolysin III family)